MKLKKLLAATLAGVMVLSLTACGGSTDDTASQDATTEASDSTATDDAADSTDAAQAVNVIQPNQDAANTTKTDETLTVALSAEPSCIYGPAVAKNENEEQIIGNCLLDTLVRYDYGTDELKPGLATEWEWVDDTHLKFTLRDGVTMSDGTPLVADDVVYTCNEIWVAQNQTTDTGKNIVGATAEDDHTVVIEFNSVAPDFLIMMSWTNFGIVTEDEINAVGGLEAASTNPLIGSGPYKFKEWKNGQSITLERNEDYWDTDYVGYFKEIVFTFTSDAASREMAVESGDADVTIDIPVSQAATYAANDAVTTAIYSFGQSTHLWYNMGDNAGATKDLAVRQAIDKAIDFDATTQVSTAGFASPCDSYFDSTCTYYSSAYTAEERAVDIEGAKQILADAGYTDPIEITILGTAENTPLYTVIQANLAEVGINVTIDTPDTAQFVEQAFGGDYDICVVGDIPSVRTTASVCPFLQNMNVYGDGMVIGGPKWTTDDIDALITDIIQESDETKLKELATEFDQVIKDNVICSNLAPEMRASVMSNDIKGFSTLMRGFIDVTKLYK